MTGKLSRNRVFSFLTVAILPAMLAGCVNLWYIPGEAGDGPVVNNTAPSAVPISLAVQEMINFLTVTGMMNNWQDIAVVCDNDPLAQAVFNGTAPILRWQNSGVEGSKILYSSKNGAVWHMCLMDSDGILWEHSVTVQESSI